MLGDCFLKLDQIPGETQDREFPGAIDVAGWSWGVNWSANRAAIKGPRHGGAADVRAFEFTHELDTASAALLTRCVRGDPIREAVLTMRRAGGTKAQAYLQITFKGVQLMSVSLLHDAENLIPLERVAFAFETVSFDYKMQSQQGGDRTGRHNFSWSMPSEG